MIGEIQIHEANSLLSEKNHESIKNKDYPLADLLLEWQEHNPLQRKSSEITLTDVFVGQREAVILRYDESNPEFKRLGTYGLGPCIAVAIVDKIKQVGALAHFDGDGSSGVAEPLNEILSSFDSENPSLVEIYLVGGMDFDESKMLLEKILEIIERSDFNGRIIGSLVMPSYVNQNINGSTKMGEDIIIDITDGSVHRVSNHDNVLLMHPPKSLESFSQTLQVKRRGIDT